MNSLLTLVALAGVAAGAVALLERLIARTDVGLWMALAVVLVTTSGLEVDAALVGFRVSAIDVVSTLLLTAAVARLLRSEVDALQWLLVAFGAVVVWSLLQGIATHGPGAAINDARTYIRFVGATLYFSTAAADDDAFDRLAVAWFTLAGGLLALTFLRWAVLVAGVGPFWFADVDDMRVIPSFDTLVLVQVLLVIWIARPPMPRVLVTAAPVLLAAVVLLQHRTLWIALAAGGLVGAVRSRRLTRRLVPAALTALIVGAALSFTVFGGTTDIRTELEQSATNADTFAWRVEGWRQLLFDRGPDEVQELALGMPFGSGFDRRIEGHIVDVSPHNFFIQTYLRTGVVGVTLLVTGFTVTLVRLRRMRGWGRYLNGPALLVVLVTQMLYLQTSHPSFEQAALLGLAIATARRAPTGSPHATRRRRRQRVAAPVAVSANGPRREVRA